MSSLLSRAVVAVALLAAASPAGAQDFFRSLLFPQRQPMPQQQQPPQPAAPGPARAAPPPAKQIKIIETPPVYQGEMARLAEILGALHYLRPLCGTKDGDRWRTEMSSLIEAEQPPAERRDQLIASFNRSYVAYEQTYRNCTPAAEVAIDRFIGEGAKLSREIATRYGN